jgi:hypothetical protein
MFVSVVLIPDCFVSVLVSVFVHCFVPVPGWF